MSTPARTAFSVPRRLEDDWTCASLPAGAAQTPAQAAVLGDWIAASVPGTAAQALAAAGRWSLDAPAALHDRDIWYRCTIVGEAGSRIRFEGLATIAEVYLDDRCVALSQSMFCPVDVILPRSAVCELAIVFRSLTQHLSHIKGRRARWKTMLSDKPTLRFVRTTLLGHMPGWCPAVDIVGPYRPVTITPPRTLTPNDVILRPRFDGMRGALEAEFDDLHDTTFGRLQLRCAGQVADFKRTGDRWRARLDDLAVRAWTAHTHGEPCLYEAMIISADGEIDLGCVGFRRIEIDTGPDGDRFSFVVNGQKVFARGACWTPPDIVSLPCVEETYRRELTLMRDAGFNMVRVPGFSIYEAPSFFKVADELGIMVWQDLQFANCDYPFDDQTFQTLAQAEAIAFLRATQPNCSLVAICGGSEMAQQAAMLGLNASVWKDCCNEARFRPLVKSLRPDVVYIANSPFGGALPFHVNVGVGHYYGVGAYRRPLEDARRADVSFASECLAFSNVPDQSDLETAPRPLILGSAEWEQRIPRDRGASWNFEHVREHYMNLLYGIDAGRLRTHDPQTYLAFARAAPAEVMEATLGEWRRPQSRNGGALIFLWRDFLPGPGWGIVDSTGRPKSIWYALQRACRPINVLLSDEGVNGIVVHAINETAEKVSLTLSLTCLAEGKFVVAHGECAIEIPAAGACSMNAVEILGSFFDVNYAYRFGPPAHDVVIARLKNEATGALLADAFYFPLGRSAMKRDPNLQVDILDGANAIVLRCASLALTVAVDDRSFIPEQNYFHLAPDEPRTIRLKPAKATSQPPTGIVKALNGKIACSY